MSNLPDNNNDEFGDDSFLATFDLNEAITQAQQKKRESVGVSFMSKNPYCSPSKRRKVSTSPQTTNDSTTKTIPGIASIQSVNASLSPRNPYRNKNSPTKVTTSPQNKSDNSATFVDSAFTHQVHEVLKNYFGYPHFRRGQLEVIHAIIQERRDVAVFWATGQGKSLCYQIPALLTANNSDNLVVVVSPLISLMQDQVHKLNGLSSDKDVATFLGSAQEDPDAERRALQGYYNLVYVTPEKVTSGNFFSSLVSLHTNPSNNKRLVLIAVDEAHMVSEWGHDFRPEFRALGKAFRQQYGAALADVPVLALTATAVPRVQDDILKSLHMRPDTLKIQHSFDRSNLKIRVSKKPPGGLSVSLRELVQQLRAASSSGKKPPSTIVYAPTRAQVDEITAYLQAQMKSNDVNNVIIESYHAGLSNANRSLAHTNFLTGQTAVIVASVAFGMGIDKPDIRSVIHYGCPKTLEEYYQQIGRAGRDGLPATCFMYVTESDFDRYKSEYYMGGIQSTQAIQSIQASMKALRHFCLDSESCRRRALLEYFHEIPPFGERCGTCDTCLSVAEHGSDTTRDFGPLGAYVVLRAILSLQEQGLSQIVKVLAGGTVEAYRYKRGTDAFIVQKLIENIKESQNKKFSQNYYRELITPLVLKGFVVERSKSVTVNGFNKVFTVYSLSTKGEHALNESLPIYLPVPESVREEERHQEEKRQRILAQLEQNGIQREKLPQEEIDCGDGEVIRAYSKWYNYLDALRRGSKDDRVAQLELLLSSIEQWRSDTAIKQLMAPGSVLAEHILVSIAYTVATMPPGMKPDASSLIAAGVRTKGIDVLIAKLAEWVDKFQPAPKGAVEEESKSFMVLGPVGNSRGWEHAVYKPGKKAGLPAWETSFLRFEKGESPQTIAMSQPNGKQPIQVKTVVAHVLEAIEHGRNVDLSRIASYMIPPNRKEWGQFQEAENVTGMDVTGNPVTSGINGEKWTMTDFLRPIIDVADIPYAERSDEDKERFAYWCERLKWYVALRRIGYEPIFKEK